MAWVHSYRTDSAAVRQNETAPLCQSETGTPQRGRLKPPVVSITSAEEFSRILYKSFDNLKPIAWLLSDFIKMISPSPCHSVQVSCIGCVFMCILSNLVNSKKWHHPIHLPPDLYVSHVVFLLLCLKSLFSYCQKVTVTNELRLINLLFLNFTVLQMCHSIKCCFYGEGFVLFRTAFHSCCGDKYIFIGTFEIIAWWIVQYWSVWQQEGLGSFWRICMFFLCLCEFSWLHLTVQRHAAECECEWLFVPGPVTWSPTQCQQPLKDERYS